MGYTLFFVRSLGVRFLIPIGFLSLTLVAAKQFPFAGAWEGKLRREEKTSLEHNQEKRL
jgi:hypothetical protein